MLGDVEKHALGAVELLLEIAGLLPALTLIDVVLGTEPFELLRELFDILYQHTEVVDATKIHPFAELVGFEFEDRHVERAVAQEDAISEHSVRSAHLHEIESLLVEFGHRFGIFGGDGDVAQLGHGPPPRIADRGTLTRPTSQFEALCRLSRGIEDKIRARLLPMHKSASSHGNRPKRSNSGSKVPLGSGKCELQVKLFGSGNCRGSHVNSARSLPRR